MRKLLATRKIEMLFIVVAVLANLPRGGGAVFEFIQEAGFPMVVATKDTNGWQPVNFSAIAVNFFFWLALVVAGMLGKRQWHRDNRT